jgi:hypothetical protein
MQGMNFYQSYVDILKSSKYEVKIMNFGNIKMMMGLFVAFLGVLLFKQLVMVGGTCNSKLGKFC